MSEEIWKDIPGFEGFYKASSIGRILPIARTVIISPRGYPQKMLRRGGILKFSLDKDGYRQLSLCMLGKSYRKKIHKLIAITFIENHQAKPCINHINGIKSDNRVENLEWVTYSENNQHAYDIGLSNKATKRVAQLSKDGVLIKEYDSIRATWNFGFNPNTVSQAMRGQRIFYKGFRWKSL